MYGRFVAEIVQGLPCRVVDHEATVKVDDFTMLVTLSKVGSREVARWRKEREETEWLVPHILDVDLISLKKMGLSWAQFRLCCTSLEVEMMERRPFRQNIQHQRRITRLLGKEQVFSLSTSLANAVSQLLELPL
jgi:hypothetical protein